MRVATKMFHHSQPDEIPNAMAAACVNTASQIRRQFRINRRHLDDYGMKKCFHADFDAAQAHDIVASVMDALERDPLRWAYRFLNATVTG